MICFPFTGERLCTRRNAIYIIFICLLFTITYLIPQLFAQKCYSIHQGVSRRNKLVFQQIWVSGLSELGKSSIYRLTVTFFFNCFLIRIIPFWIIFQLNFRLIRTLANTKRRHSRLNPFERKRNDVTYMLVIVISTYLVCVIPSIPFSAFFAYDPHRYVDISFHYRSFQYFDELAKFLLIFNSATQCYLYIFFGKRFRRELTSCYRCLCVKYFSMSIPRTSSFDNQEQFDALELVLQGQWSLDSEHHSLTGLEFTFHYAKRPSHLSTSSNGRLVPIPDDEHNQINFNLLKRLKIRVEKFLSNFK